MALPQLFAELADVPWLLTALDLVGVFFFAVSGALLAARKDFDLVGSVALALLAGLGGGITRDIVLDRGLPASLQDPIYLAPPVLVSLLVYVKAIHPNRLNLTITLFDAAGLALFTVSGVMIAHAMGVHPVSVVVVATVGALGGGVVHGPTPRDYSQRTPKKMKAAALRGALSDRARNNRIHVVEALVEGTVPNTKAAQATLRGLSDRKNLLVVLHR